VTVSRRAMPQFRGSGRGRHAIRRAGALQDSSRRRHAQRILPEGVHRTRMSEVRGSRVCADGLSLRRHPYRSPERIPAVRLPVF
jgi:hypothetical protein